MLLVPTYVAQSKIHGIGLFAKDRIREGSLVWKYNPAIDVLLSCQAVERMPQPLRDFMLHYASRIAPDLYMLCGDDARFVNHHPIGNIACQDNTIDCDDIALRDIEAGEEIVENYARFCIDFKGL
jgi:SET domain-containing protein